MTEEEKRKKKEENVNKYIDFRNKKLEIFIQGKYDGTPKSIKIDPSINSILKEKPKSENVVYLDSKGKSIPFDNIIESKSFMTHIQDRDPTTLIFQGYIDRDYAKKTTTLFSDPTKLEITGIIFEQPESKDLIDYDTFLINEDKKQNKPLPNISEFTNYLGKTIDFSNNNLDKIIKEIVKNNAVTTLKTEISTIFFDVFDYILINCILYKDEFKDIIEKFHEKKLTDKNLGIIRNDKGKKNMEFKKKWEKIFEIFVDKIKQVNKNKDNEVKPLKNSAKFDQFFDKYYPYIALFLYSD